MVCAFKGLKKNSVVSSRCFCCDQYILRHIFLWLLDERWPADTVTGGLIHRRRQHPPVGIRQLMDSELPQTQILYCWNDDAHCSTEALVLSGSCSLTHCDLSFFFFFFFPLSNYCTVIQHLQVFPVETPVDVGGSIKAHWLCWKSVFVQTSAVFGRLPFLGLGWCS